MSEEWRQILGFSQYESSNMGAVRNKISNRLIKWQKNKRGYLVTNLLNDDGVRKQIYAHRAILLAFIGKCPDTHEIDHLNEVKDDNRVCNLEYVNRRENVIRYYANRGRKHDLPVGVQPHRKHFSANIHFKGKLYYLGNFPTPELASERYKAARIEVETGTFKGAQL